MRIVLAISVVFLLPSCATTASYQAILSSWEGAPAAELLSVWGQPDEVQDLSHLKSELGQSVAYFTWMGENRSEAEQARIDDTSTTTHDCTGNVGYGGNVNVNCSEGTGTDFYKLGYSLGAGPRRYCKVTATVVDGYVKSFNSVGNACVATESAAAQYSRSR
jgi:hypothetical protein